MPKLIGLFRHKEGFTIESFRDYYESNHVPLALSYFGHLFTSYTRSYVEHPVHGEHDDIDVVTEIGFADDTDMAAMFAMTRDDPALQRTIAADEAAFMDTTATRLMIIADYRSSPLRH